MISCVELVFAALAIVAPSDGGRVPVLFPVQKEYMALPTEKRFSMVNSSEERVKLLSGGQYQPPLRLEWEGPTNGIYRLEIGVSGSGRIQRFAITNRTHVYMTNLELAREYDWKVSGRDGSAAGRFVTEDTPPRLIRVEGVRNFRDIGGWKGLGGRRVRQDMIFRSAGLRASAQKKSGSFISAKYEPGTQRVTEKGIRTLREIGIRTNLELRRPTETVCMHSSVIGSDVKWVCEQLVAYDFIDNHERGRVQFAKIFPLFLEKANYPVLFHCSGGRDRTGTLAFLLGALLGVGKDDLCRDWEATVFTEASVAFGSSRISSLVSYLESLGGGDVVAGAEKYADLCGITEEQIARFRELMLEDVR